MDTILIDKIFFLQNIPVPRIHESDLEYSHKKPLIITQFDWDI